jgi:ABC-type glycerol-3-phosphate transport system permease component
MKIKLLKYFGYLILVIFAITFIYPFLWMISATLKPEIEIQYPNLIPSEFSLKSYYNVFMKIPIGRAFFNSVFVSGSVTALVLIFSSMVGYALAQLKFRGRELLFSIMLLTMMIPFQVTLIPMYVLMVKFGWVNTYMALIFPAMISVFGIFLLRQYFKAFPKALIEVARLDGCSELYIVFKLVWPNSIPALVTVGIITFMNSWNDVRIDDHAANGHIVCYRRPGRCSNGNHIGSSNIACNPGCCSLLNISTAIYRKHGFQRYKRIIE